MSSRAELPKAVVLLSGGMDSVTCLAIARAEGFAPYALTVDYGQRHRIELELARQQASLFGAVEHRVVSLDLNHIARSALTADIEVPKDEIPSGVPVTYVPARNAIMLSLALAWAEVLGATDLFIGVNQVDYSGYPDCRQQFIKAFEKMANLATCMTTEDPAKKVHIHTPLLELDKAQIVRRGVELGVDYARTLTCYDPNQQGLACGRCPSCQLRLKGFAAAGMEDPAGYVVDGDK